MVGRLLQAADFKRLLSVPPRARSPHFVVHHLRGVPEGAMSRFSRPSLAATEPRDSSLSTDRPRILSRSVDNSSALIPQQAWMGVVLPKKQARRAVTRNLMRRQIKAVSERVLSPWVQTQGAGLWLVRLKQGFAAAEFPSASSAALRRAVRAELDELFQRALQRIAAHSQQTVAAVDRKP